MDDWKRTAVEWGRKYRKLQSRTFGRGILKRETAKLPREPEVHPCELEEIEHRARCRELGICDGCGMPEHRDRRCDENGNRLDPAHGAA